MKNEKLLALIEEYKGVECSFSKMECAFADVTGDEVLNDISVEELLDNESVSFVIGDNEFVNVEFEVVENNGLDSIIKITDISFI